MARATHVMKARKDVPGTDIKAGESYYWWKFKRGGKHFSKTPPKRSQLTQSNFYAQIFDIEDEVGAATGDDSLPGLCEDIASRLRELGGECQGNLDNMPEGLQQGSTGELLQERVSAMETAADEFESIDFGDPDSEFDEPERNEGESDEDYESRKDDEREQFIQEYWDGKLDEVQQISIEAP